MADTRVFATVQRLTSEVLAGDLEEVTPEARFLADLGGESIDLLELMFLCEREYGVKMPLKSMFSNEDLGPDGRLRPESVERLKRDFPEENIDAAVSSSAGGDVRNLLTVRMIATFVAKQIAQAAAGQPT